MGVEKVRKDDTARTFEFLFRFNRVWINGRLLLLLLLFSFATFKSDLKKLCSFTVEWTFRTSDSTIDQACYIAEMDESSVAEVLILKIRFDSVRYSRKNLDIGSIRYLDTPHMHFS